MAVQSSDLRHQLLGAFFEESAELLERLEGGLLSLDRQGKAGAEIHDIFRAAHSLKGAAGTFGFPGVVEIAHVMENVLDGIRNDAVAVTAEITTLLLEAVDRLRSLVEAARSTGETAVDPGDLPLRQRLAGAAAASTRREAELPPVAAAATATTAHRRWRVDFRPLPSLIRTGNDPLRILRELAALGTFEVSCDASAVPELEHLATDDCRLAWSCRLTGNLERAAIAEVFSWVDEDAAITIAEEATAAETTPEAPVTSVSNAAGAVTGASGPDTATDGAAAPSAAARERDRNLATVRVSVDKIDLLMNMVGELVITRSMLSDLDGDAPIDGPRLGRLREGLAQLARNTRLLQDSVMRLRSMPVGVVFGRLPRMVHDLGRQLGKQVELKIHGETTELDKTVLEKLGDPLVHLVRNSLDHGLETPAERLAAGKPAQGTLELRAYHQGSSIVVEVADDGRGLDLSKILAAARRRGLVGPNETPSDSALREMIFAPGFSTASTVTDVSGRGVGMDVVRRNIKELAGEIGVDSTPGRGTRVALRLPLTLAIVDGQLVRVGPHSYVIPLLSIVDLVELDRALVGWAEGGREVYRLGGDLVPLIPLHPLLGVGADGRDARMVVVVEADGQRIGLLVDELQSQQQVVVKSLESNYARVEGVSGATILGDGGVAFILDVSGLRRLDRTLAARRDQGRGVPPRDLGRQRPEGEPRAWMT